MDLLDTTTTVETPERVRFRHRLAGPGQRSAAWGIDVCLQLLTVIILGLVVTIFATIPGLEGIGMGIFLLGLFVLQWLYGAVFETILSGRTPGKMLLDLRVVRRDGSPGRMPDFLLRNLLRFVDFMPIGFGLGVLTMALDPKMRRIGDLVAGTVVVAEDRSGVLGVVTIDPPVTEQERQALPPGIVLSTDERQVIEAFLRRRARLSDERAEELARLFGPVLAERTGIDAPTNERILTLAYARVTGRDRPPDEEVRP